MTAPKFLYGSDGKQSSTRFIFVFGMLWSMALTTILAFSANLEVGGIIALFTGTSGVFVGLKLGQKPMEGKKPNA